MTQLKLVQSVMRRYLAQKRIHKLRGIIQRDKAIEFHNAHQAGLDAAAKRDKLRKKEEILRAESALKLQKRYRGVLGRRRFDNILQFHLENLAALRCQTAFRKALARRAEIGGLPLRKLQHDGRFLAGEAVGLCGVFVSRALFLCSRKKNPKCVHSTVL